ncbi:hypothetical protein HY484_01985 [Candidatus Woesearchaeota archaeon]|nr:hypothetical protein [Candidatus Woesearchaeota archaeon]
MKKIKEISSLELFGNGDLTKKVEEIADKVLSVAQELRDKQIEFKYDLFGQSENPPQRWKLEIEGITLPFRDEPQLIVAKYKDSNGVWYKVEFNK